MIKKLDIQTQAKEILDNFAESLKDVKFKEKGIKSQVGGFREEGAGKSANPEFRERLFANAPNTKGDCIIAEKKKW
jgi:hypothetical protein